MVRKGTGDTSAYSTRAELSCPPTCKTLKVHIRSKPQLSLTEYCTPARGVGCDARAGWVPCSTGPDTPFAHSISACRPWRFAHSMSKRLINGLQRNRRHSTCIQVIRPFCKNYKMSQSATTCMMHKHHKWAGEAFLQQKKALNYQLSITEPCTPDADVGCDGCAGWGPCSAAWATPLAHSMSACRQLQFAYSTSECQIHALHVLVQRNLQTHARELTNISMHYCSRLSLFVQSCDIWPNSDY